MIFSLASNAVYANRIAEISDAVERSKSVDDVRREYEIDVVVTFEQLRREPITRFELADVVDRDGVAKRHGVYGG